MRGITRTLHTWDIVHQIIGVEMDLLLLFITQKITLFNLKENKLSKHSSMFYIMIII